MEDQKRVRLIGINRKFDIIEAYSDWQAGKTRCYSSQLLE